MAAISLAKNQLWGGGTVRLTFSASYERVRSGSNVEYKLHFTIDPLPTTQGQYFGYNIKVSAKVGDNYMDWGSGVTEKQFKASSPSQWNSAITYSATKSISKTTGTTPLVIYLSSNAGSDRSKQFSYALEVPPAAASITSVNGGNPIEISVGTAKSVEFACSTYVTSMWHKMKVSSGSLTLYDGDVDTTGGTYKISLTGSKINELINAMPTSSVATAVFALTTYSDSSYSKVVGSSSKNATVTLNANIKPAITNAGTATWYDGGRGLNIGGKYVQGETYARITGTTAQPALGSNISRYEIRVANSSESRVYSVDYASQFSYDTPLEISGNVSVKIKAVDSRGRESGYSDVTSIYVFEYSPPKIETYSSERCTSAAVLDTEGTYFRAAMSCSYSPLNSGSGISNPMTLKYSYKKSSGTVFSEKEVFVLNGGVSLALGGGDIDTSSSYDVKYTICDKFYPDGIDVIDYVSSAQFTLFLAKGGNVVSVGEAYNPTAQEIADKTKLLNISQHWQTRINGDIYNHNNKQKLVPDTAGVTDGYVPKKQSDGSIAWAAETGGGGGGTDDYNALLNRPKINGVTLTGDKSTSDLGINANSVGLGNVTNKSEATIKSDFTGSIADGNTGFVKGGDAFDALTDISAEVAGKYTKPSGGIPASDLASGVIPAAPGSLDTNHTDAQTVKSYESLSGNVKLHRVSKTGAYSDLNGRPTKVSEFTNDAGYLTSHQSLAAYRTSAAQDVIDDEKVDKESGKGLSTNDYTNDDKNKLAGIESGAEVNEIDTIVAGANVTVTKSGKTVTISASGGGGGGGNIPATTNLLMGDGSGNASDSEITADEVIDALDNKIPLISDKAEIVILGYYGAAATVAQINAAYPASAHPGAYAYSSLMRKLFRSERNSWTEVVPSSHNVYIYGTDERWFRWDGSYMREANYALAGHTHAALDALVALGLPTPTIADKGKVLGVDDNGHYAFISVTPPTPTTDCTVSVSVVGSAYEAVLYVEYNGTKYYTDGSQFTVPNGASLVCYAHYSASNNLVKLNGTTVASGSPAQYTLTVTSNVAVTLDGSPGDHGYVLLTM